MCVLFFVFVCDDNDGGSGVSCSGDAGSGDSGGGGRVTRKKTSDKVKVERR